MISLDDTASRGSRSVERWIKCKSCGSESSLTPSLTFYRIRQIQILRSLTRLPKSGGARRLRAAATARQWRSGYSRKRGRGRRGSPGSQCSTDTQRALGWWRGARGRAGFFAGVGSGDGRARSRSRTTLQIMPRQAAGKVSCARSRQ